MAGATHAGRGLHGRWTLVLVFLVSATILAQEVALLRVLAIAHWHHAAQMVIAVALCGFGAAATLVAIFPKLANRVVAHAVAAAYAVSIPGVLALASGVRFNALAVGWEPSQWLRLFALQAIFVASIVLGALSIQICLALAGPRVGRTYAVNLAGSGLGALAVLPLLHLGSPEQVLGWLALLPAVAALPRARTAGCAAILAVLLIPPVELEMTAYKSLPLALDLPQAAVIETRHLPHARIDLVRAPSLRVVEGLSLHSTATVPPMTLVTVDGEAAGAITGGPAGFFRDTLAAAPLAFVADPRALVIGGAGNLHEAALGADRVRRVDVAWTGENPRAFLAHTDARFDVVWMRVPRTVAMSEDVLATREAFAAALAVTTGSGVVFVSVPIHTPPREELKVLRTALAVTPHVTAIRSLDLLGIMLRRRDFAPAEQAALAEFCRSRGFDRIAPGTRVHESGHRDYLAVLGGGSVAGHYRSEPATDDAPYFHRFMPWDRIGDALAATGALDAAQVDWGTLVVLVATAQVTLLGIVLLLLPLLTLGGDRPPGRERPLSGREKPLPGREKPPPRREKPPPRREKPPPRREKPPPRREKQYALFHFAAIGFAYAAIEMAFLGRLTTLMGRPEYAAGVVLCAFLLASGLGSLTGSRTRHGAWLAAALALGALATLDSVRSPLLALAIATGVAVPMGIPFPAGLRRLHARAPGLVPWALAVNGCASVAAFSAAPLLASDVGYSGLILGGAVLYLAVGAADREAGGA